MRATIRSVAGEAGVSTATVSYVLSGRRGVQGGAGVSPATIRRVREAADRLGYQPNPAARAIRTGRTNTVLLSLTMLSDPWSLAVIEAVQRRAAPLGITPLILADADWAQVLQSHDADAVFIDAVPPDHREDLLRLAGRGTRLVVFSEVLEPAGFDVIRSLALPGCGLAMGHLLRSHTRIGCLTSGRGIDPQRPSRYLPYVEALADAGLELREDYVESYEVLPASAYDAAVRLLSNPERPTAIYATTDFAAMSAINAAQRMGLTVGRDIDIIGVGNTVEGERMTPSLSSVGPAGFFDAVATLLLDRAKGEGGEPEVLEFPWQLFARESAPLRQGSGGGSHEQS
ncbi:LacI family DNA-binding transcriptional regulator [Arthrobacter sp. SDTb3-6]|uniref:LacI family DNA-binding transcriptional regulator n=1 Tax=Arthrobacter sp. SDTb3-6 TaxID=2713571 RepID=UPI00159D3EB1|nr:LacI family DNA-binding transcriptional regulator [Arthrobacter sp. SDTb3-6]NVN00334.1 LacI family transcriptional regulator [Arthrobacter sp. SDTb3-6]